MFLWALEKQEQTKDKNSKEKKMTTTRAEIKKTKMKDIIQRINKRKSCQTSRQICNSDWAKAPPSSLSLGHLWFSLKLTPPPPLSISTMQSPVGKHPTLF